MAGLLTVPVALTWTVYAVVPALLVGFFPWLRLAQEGRLRRRELLLLAAVAGLAMPLANWLRTSAFLPLAALALVALGQLRHRLREPAVRGVAMQTAAVFAALALLASAWIAVVQDQRDDFLVEYLDGYERGMHRHVTWHWIYIGLGYMQGGPVRWNDL